MPTGLSVGCAIREAKSALPERSLTGSGRFTAIYRSPWVLIPSIAGSSQPAAAPPFPRLVTIAPPGETSLSRTEYPDTLPAPMPQHSASGVMSAFTTPAGRCRCAK